MFEQGGGKGGFMVGDWYRTGVIGCGDGGVGVGVNAGVVVGDGVGTASI